MITFILGIIGFIVIASIPGYIGVKIFKTITKRYEAGFIKNNIIKEMLIEDINLASKPIYYLVAWLFGIVLIFVIMATILTTRCKKYI